MRGKHMSNAAAWTPPTDVKPSAASQVVKIRAVAEWAELQTVNKMSQKHQIVLTQLSDHAAAQLEAMGIKIFNKSDKAERGNYITAKSSNPIKAYDAAGNEIIANVGNGSELEVVIGAYSWTDPQGKPGVSPTIKRLTVTNLITFNEEGESFDDLPAF